MSRLDFPLWVRALSLVQRQGNDGLTRSERAHLARRYWRGPGNPRLSPAERAAMRAWMDARRKEDQ